MLLLLNTLFLGKNFLYFSELASTNAEAMQLIADFPAEGTVILADNQTQGRGQAGTHWETLDGENLTFSLIFYPTFLGLTEAFYLSKMAAVALHKCLSHVLSAQKITIKWANDLNVSDKKIAGILIENQLEGQKIKASVIGIGLNVNQTAFSPEIAAKTTSFQIETQRQWDREAILVSLLGYMEAEYFSLKKGKYAELDAYYLSHLLGYQVDRLFSVAGETKSGHVVGVEKSGRLVVAFGEKVERFDIKEIEWL